ncbi:aminomethyl-transferring glycine dehydrogenase subunit GcvPA [bacterium]|nr:aminomethyl-transferring glycine dehydrogenase subunit GcvPA [bacterium]
MAYIPHTDADRSAMLATIGARSIDELFEGIPASVRLARPLDFPARSEFEVDRYFEERAAENRVYTPGRSFLGAGAYAHFTPAAVLHLVQRGEFMTCYTPYQAEVSQGTLQMIFEFQSHMCALTGLDVANASLYDGATALCEAVAMAVRHTRERVVYIPELLLPAYREVCEAQLVGLDVELRTIPARGALTDWAAIQDIGKAAAVVIATPNRLGGIEDGRAARALANRFGALLIACVNPTSLAILAAPSEYGADIAVGEAQPLGLPLSFGGPYAGFFTCKRELIRKMPGRIVGRTKDAQGRDGFVLTLQAREQHIRRDKATSNICTNQGLFAALATMYLTFVGREGLVEVAETSLLRTSRLAARLVAETPISRYESNAPHFHEVALRLPISSAKFLAEMRDTAGILAGFDLSRWGYDANLLLVNCTELVTERDIDAYVAAARAILARRENGAV